MAVDASKLVTEYMQCKPTVDRRNVKNGPGVKALTSMEAGYGDGDALATIF